MALSPPETSLAAGVPARIAPPLPETSTVPVWSRSMEIGFAFLLGCGVMFLLHAAWQRGFEGGVATKLVAAPPVDLNTADEQTLTQVPGIGPQRARRIIERRQQMGMFDSVGDLEQVKGIGPFTVERVRPALRLTGGTDGAPTASPPKSNVKKTGPILPVDLNLATDSELQTIAGIGPVLAERIINYRDAHGPFVKVEDLVQVPGIKTKTLEKMRSYLFVGSTPKRRPTTPQLLAPLL